MKPEDQRIAIAEACGWTSYQRESPLCPPTVTMWKDPSGMVWGDVPNYLSDLNAMAEAENILAWDQREEFVRQLHLCHPTASIGLCCEYGDVQDEVFDLVHASASMRAEAFLKTLGLWKYSPPLNAGETPAPKH